MADYPFEPLFASDLAAEVRSEFVDRVRFGVPVMEASAAVVARFGALLADPNDGPVVIVCLAALQLDLGGEVQASVRDSAIDLIRSGEAARAWRADDPDVLRSRRALLDGLANALEACPPLADVDLA